MRANLGGGPGGKVGETDTERDQIRLAGHERPGKRHLDIFARYELAASFPSEVYTIAPAYP